MKRAADTDNTLERASSSGKSQGKRPKSSQACSSCRKHKTRCELLDGPSEGPYRCHRCKVLNISCSFESSEFAPSLQQSPSPSPLPLRAVFLPPPSRISPPNISNNGVTPENDTHNVKFEDLLPLPPKPWGFVKVPGGFDWSTTPMLAMQGITTSRPQLDEDQLIGDVNTSLANILSPERVNSLLNIFESTYSPWLNLQPDQGVDCPMLTLARLLVASRHLDSVTRAAVVPHLQKLLGEVLYGHLFNPIPSPKSIQAVIILSLWSPIGGGAQASVRDGRLLIASGVSMAMNLRLSQAVEYVCGLRSDIKKDQGVSPVITSDLEDAMDKARLWLCLMNAESMLCIGTGRVPLSRRTELDLTMIDSTSNATVESTRDTRLSLIGQIFEVAEAGLRIHLSSKSEFDKFYKEVLGVLMKLDNLLRLIAPLPIVVDHESSYFHILRIYHHTCRLLFIHHCLHETRRVVTVDPARQDRPWYMLAEYNGVNLAAHWGQEALLLAEDILSSTISQPKPNQLGSAPDNVFAMVCFAATFIVMCKISVYQSHGEHISGSSDGLLAKVIDRLLLAACSPDHAPAKCAQLIRKLVASYEARTMKSDGVSEHLESQVSHNILSERTSAINQDPESGFGVDGQPPHFDASLSSYGVSLDLNRLMNSDVMLDSDFWASFMDNLTTDVPYGEGVRSN